MLFSSFDFIAWFLPPALVAWMLARRFAPRSVGLVLLIAVSLIFYAQWRRWDVPILVGSVLANYLFGRMLAGGGGAPSRRRDVVLALGIAANLALLARYKYAAFGADALSALTGTPITVAAVPLPLGISFFTFIQIAYLVDCRQGRCDGWGFLDYANFVTFFPHLLAGPIVHHHELIPQFQARRPVGPDDLAIGLVLFTIGLAKKLVLADNLAPIAETVFKAADAGTAPGTATAWLGLLAFTFQIYFDFSGYSDMAIGLARLFGIRFPANFDSPYRATSIIAFWRRWHITLSRWLRDYLYVPLGGSRKGSVRRAVNLMITMVLGGLWHGAHWNFVIWGALHGALLVAAHACVRVVPPRIAASLPARAVGWAVTFVAVVAGWAFFRASTTDGAATMLASAFGTGGDAARGAWTPASQVFVVAATLTVFLTPNSNRIASLVEAGRIGPAAVGAAGGALAFLILLATNGLPPSPFIYFNF